METTNTSANTLKKLFKTVFTFALLITMYVNFGITKVFAQPRISASITYQSFYDELSPYGNWIEYPGYNHVWSPNVDGDFRPYLTNGNWEYTTDGWAWASNYDWGWAPFHYGRWLYDPQYGWLWIPGYEWSPAWVTWGEVDDYFAWAPLGPRVNVGYAYDNWRPNSFYWNIVPREHIYDRDVSRFAEDRRRDNDFSNRIQMLNNFNRTSIHNQYYSRGPELKNVEQYTKRQIVPASIKSVDKIMPARRDGNNNLQIYRPAVVHPQPAVFKRMNSDNIPMRAGDEGGSFSTRNSNQQNNNNSRNPQLMENNRQNENRIERKAQPTENPPQNQNMEIRRSQSIENTPRIQNTEEQRMPSVDRSMQRQNIERMPEMRSPSGSFENRMPGNSGRRK
ncbi:DUF6600 domain-containing protein [Kaistella sp.]|uniref:DUF6600 domain-containing protein n=1 Tax=Kaistella sp. TaxID=2782235 RepID=UPI003C5438DE